jgi:hypothetical protein
MALIFVVTAVRVVVNEVWVHLSDHCLCEHQPINVSIIYRVGQDSAVGIATHYGLDGPGIESQWGAKFSVPDQTGPGTYEHQPINISIIYRFGQDSAVGIATHYGLDGPGTESRWGAKFSVPDQTGPGTHPAPHIMYTRSFPGVKRPGRGVDHPPHLAPGLQRE